MTGFVNHNKPITSLDNDINISQNRDSIIDIIKGIGIICMVMGHCGSPITEFIYLFHMAIFFMASGYCYKSKYSDSYNDLLIYTKRKFISLWIPYVVWTSVYSILHNFFIFTNIYTDNLNVFAYLECNQVIITERWTWVNVLSNIVKAFFLHGSTQMGGALWFIATLMELSIVFCLIDYFVKLIAKNIMADLAQAGISICFLILGYYCYLKKYSLFGFDKVLSFYILFFIGHLIKKYKVLNYKSWYFHLLILCSTFIILMLSKGNIKVLLDQNMYGNPIYLVIVSISGWFFLYEIAYYINRLKLINKIMVCIGQNTMSIVILHFLCFKLVSYIGILVNAEDIILLSAFPILYRNAGWWVIYFLVGVSIPIVFSFLWKKIKSLRNN